MVDRYPWRVLRLLMRHEDLKTTLDFYGFAAYPEAVDLAFGPFAAYGQIIKEYRNSRLQYDPSEIIGTIRGGIRGIMNTRSICTSHIERHNLTVRTFTKRFARLSLGFSKS